MKTHSRCQQASYRLSDHSQSLKNLWVSASLHWRSAAVRCREAMDEEILPPEMGPGPGPRHLGRHSDGLDWATHGKG